MTRSASIVAIALALALTACGKEGREVASGTVTDGEGNQASYSVRDQGDGKTVTVKSADGTATIRTGDADAALPAGLALYPGAKVTSSMTMASDKEPGHGAMLSFETADTPAQVIAFYKNAATSAGYTIGGEVKTGEMEMLTTKKGEKGGFVLTAAKSPAGTAATLIGGAQ